MQCREWVVANRWPAETKQLGVRRAAEWQPQQFLKESVSQLVIGLAEGWGGQQDTRELARADYGKRGGQQERRTVGT